MMILAVDTALAACSAAVFDSDEQCLLAARFESMATGHAEAIAPMVQETMQAAGLEYGSLHRIAVTIGPGTFTGLRIGLAFARGLGLALSLPVVGVSSLKALAANIAENPGELSIVAAIDARRGNVYLQLYTPLLVPLREPRICPLAEAARSIPEGRYLAVGSAARTLIAAEHPQAVLIKAAASDQTTAATVARLAAGEKPGVLPPEPLYLREPDAKPQNVQSGRIEIRDASAVHAPLLAALHSQCFERGWNAEAMAGIVAMPGAVALLAQSEGGEPLGFVIARCAADEAEILTMGVVPSRRRCSVAEKLLGEVAGRLSGRGARNLHIEVAESNSAALGLYEKIGFMRSGRRRDYYAAQGGLREDAVTMTRPLPIAPHHV